MQKRLWAGLGVAIVVGALLTGCSNQRTAGPLNAQSSETAKVMLLDGGAEPRQVLKISPTADSVQKVRITQTVRGQNSLSSGNGLDTGDISTRTDLTSTIKTIETDGTFHAEVVYDAIGANPDVPMSSGAKENIAQSSEPLVSATQRLTIAANGVATEAKIDRREGLGKAANKFLDAKERELITYQSTLPAEAIGVGGSWQVSIPLTLNDISVTTVTTYTVVAINSQDVELSLIIKQQTNGTKFDVNSQEVDVEKWDISGTGTQTINLGQIFPAKSSITIGGTQVLNFGGLIGTKVDQNVSRTDTVEPLTS